MKKVILKMNGAYMYWLKGKEELLCKYNKLESKFDELIGRKRQLNDKVKMSKQQKDVLGVKWNELKSEFDGGH